MQNNPPEQWRQLTETYRAMFDGELENLARDLDDLTETAREVLRGEMKSRGLALPGDKSQPGRPHPAGKVDPGAFTGEPYDPEDAADDNAPAEFTWKVPLVACEDRAHADAIGDALRRAGIESWYESAASGWNSSGPRLVVAADQLEEARQIAAMPIGKEIIDEYREEPSPYETPRCPECGEEDPVLESAEPTNSWLCEACGHAWTDPADGPGASA